MIKNNNFLYNFYTISKNLLFFVFLFCLINFQTSLSFFSFFETSTPNLISIVIYLCIVRVGINPSNALLFFIGFFHDIVIGNNLAITSIFLILFKYFIVTLILNKEKQEEWISFTIIFISSFSIVLLLNTIINLSIPDLTPIFFHIGITLILFPIINMSMLFFNFVTRLIKG